MNKFKKTLNWLLWFIVCPKFRDIWIDFKINHEKYKYITDYA